MDYFTVVKIEKFHNDQFTVSLQEETRYFLYCLSSGAIMATSTCSLFLVTTFFTILNQAVSSGPVITTLNGPVEGSTLKAEKGSCIHAYRGIPYAEPPVGELRFMDPRPARSWPATLDATKLGSKCPQNPSYAKHEVESEDCLALNVYKSCEAGQKNTPVMVWFHGGRAKAGSGGDYFYGPEYLLDRDVILVTINYRLVPFAFISLESEAMPGNQGMKDQVLALKWIKNNINRFGGDPKQITIFGEGSGAGPKFALSHMTSLSSRGLFNGVISHSGAPVDIIKDDKQGTYRQRVMDMASSLGCRTSALDTDIVQCLQGIDWETFYKAGKDVWNEHLGRGFGNIVDKEFSTTPVFEMEPEAAFASGQFAKVPVMIGFNKDSGINSVNHYRITKYNKDPTRLKSLNDHWLHNEGGIKIFGQNRTFSHSEEEKLKKIREFYFGSEEISERNIQGLINMFSDLSSWVPAHRIATLISSHKSPVYEFMFSHVSEEFSYAHMQGASKPWLGVCLADELHYLFKPSIVEGPVLGGDDLAVKELMLDLWVSFATHGRPSSGSLKQWFQFINTQPSYLSIEKKPRMDFSQDFQNRIEFWNNLFPASHSHPSSFLYTGRRKHSQHK